MSVQCNSAEMGDIAVVAISKDSWLHWETLNKQKIITSGKFSRYNCTVLR